MRLVPAVRPHFALGILALLLAGCTDQPTEPPSKSPPSIPGDLQTRAIAVHVDVAAGTVTTLDRPSAAVASGVQLALLGANEIGASASNFSRSAVGAFIPKKVRIRFDVAITNRSSVALLAPTFPTPPAGVQSVLLFPFSTSLTGGNGAVDASTDWNGDGSAGSGAPMNFFNDASCSSGGKSDCYRWEGYPVPFAPGTTTAAHLVGFDVDPTVQSFTVYFVLAADLQIPGSITGTVKAPGYGDLPGVTVSLSPVGRVTTPASGTGAYGFSGLAPGAYSVSLSGLPAECLASTKQATVVSGSATTVNFTVICQLIAFSSERDNGLAVEIYVMHRDGSNQRRLTSAGGFFVSFEAAWSPDGRTIAFERNDLSANQDEENFDTEIYTVDVDGGGEHRLTDNTFSEGSPTWSPDGSKIAFVSNRDGQSDVYLMNPDGTGVTRLTNTPLGEFALAWSPDGTKIAFGGITTPGSGAANIYVMSSNGTGTTQLTSTNTDGRPAWSPDGSKIAFESDRNGAGLREVYVMDANGQNQTRLTVGGSAAQPTWSADGTRIAFTRLSPAPGSLDIYIMNADGTDVQQLTTAGGYDNFAGFQR